MRGESWTMFGRGQREELDEEDAEGLVERMRVEVRREVKRLARWDGEGMDPGEFEARLVRGGDLRGGVPREGKL